MTFLPHNLNALLLKCNLPLGSILPTSCLYLQRQERVSNQFFKQSLTVSRLLRVIKMHLRRPSSSTLCMSVRSGFISQAVLLIIFTSYDRYRGVISLVNIQNGILRKGQSSSSTCFETPSPDEYLGDKIASCHTRKKYEIAEIGIMYPEEVSTDILCPGQVGYIACNMKESSEGMCQQNNRILCVPSFDDLFM